MSADDASRRGFLKLAGMGIAGTVLGGRATRSFAYMSRTGQANSPQTVFDLKAFGATADGKTLDTPAINKAIDAASSAGGGVVRFPVGTYLCFSIRLKSNVALLLDPGATILGADSTPGANGNGYDIAEPNRWDMYQDFGHSHWRNSLIWGEDLENVSILGPGLIWGKSLSRGDGTGPNAEVPGVGNKVIALKNCRNVTLRDFSVLHGGHFAVLATGVDNFTIDNLKIDTNRDGIDIDCCRNVKVSNCSVNSPYDDGICLKSSYGLGYARPTERVAITNCYVTGRFKVGALLDGSLQPVNSSAHPSGCGRIKFGTESNGGFKNIVISNCIFEDCQGLALETVDGGLLEDVAITNLAMRGIVSAPIFLRLGSRMRGPAGVEVGQLRRINISNIVVSGSSSRFASIISGIPGHRIEDVHLSDIHIQQEGGGTNEDSVLMLPEKETEYPEPTMFGTTPAYGFYVRHVKGITMTNVGISSMKKDLRPAFVLDDVEAGDFFRVKLQPAGAAPAFALKTVEDFSVSGSAPIPDTRLSYVDEKKL
jgi:polygalacturonase